jgi:hypothetical protein
VQGDYVTIEFDGSPNAYLEEALHPEVKHGGAPGKAGGGKQKAKGVRVASFAADTAKKTGLSARTVQEDVQVLRRSPE